ncbi:MAG: hypothetical protein H7329_12395 [Opitutaceae bacterium]|nr:hypothetical protein [Cytophagales bacterium]
MKFSIFLFIVISFQDCFSQSDVFNRSNHQKGIYRTYQEFLDNDPFYKSQFDSVTKTLTKEKFKDGDSTMVYKITILAKDGIGIDSLWGLCDGKDVYVKQQHDVRSYYFFLVNKWDRYSLVNTFEYVTVSQAIGSGAGYGPIGAIGTAAYVLSKINRKKTPYLINFNNGHKFLLTNGPLSKILKGEPELRIAYLKEKYDEDYSVMIKYISKYNELHRGEIKVKLK